MLHAAKKLQKEKEGNDQIKGAKVTESKDERIKRGAEDGDKTGRRRIDEKSWEDKEEEEENERERERGQDFIISLPPLIFCDVSDP